MIVTIGATIIVLATSCACLAFDGGDKGYGRVPRGQCSTVHYFSCWNGWHHKLVMMVSHLWWLVLLWIVCGCCVHRARTWSYVTRRRLLKLSWCLCRYKLLMKARWMARVRSGLDLLHDALRCRGWWRACRRSKIYPVSASTLLLHLLVHFFLELSFLSVPPLVNCFLFHAF